MIEEYPDTTIGADYLKRRKRYNVDTLLDYLSALKIMRSHHPEDSKLAIAHDREIEAVKLILKIQVEANNRNKV